jgi:hypothetical protein
MGIALPVETGGMTHGLCRRCAEGLRRQELGRPSRVLVVARSAELAAGIATAFGALRGIVVVPDRREGERRQGRSSVPTERRQLDRRRPWASQRDPWDALGIQVVPLQEADRRPRG